MRVLHLHGLGKGSAQRCLSVCRLPWQVAALSDMRAAGHAPDLFTFTALINACQRANEAELAFEVLKVMKQRGFEVDEVLCFILVRLCYNRLRSAWRPGGYPPSKAQQDRISLSGGAAAGGAGRALLKALTSTEPEAEALCAYPGPGDGGWARRALGVYHDALAAGARPRLHVLERLLACLRLPHQRPHEALLPLQVRALSKGFTC